MFGFQGSKKEDLSTIMLTILRTVIQTVITMNREEAITVILYYIFVFFCNVRPKKINNIFLRHFFGKMLFEGRF